MNDPGFNPTEIAEECNDRLDQMVNQLITIARDQGAVRLGPSDLIKIKATFEKQVSPFMLPFLAATATVRLVNQGLAETTSE